MQDRLIDLKLNQSAIIIDIATPDEIEERLHSLGVIEGLKIRFVKATPLGDPLIYQVINAYIAIRKDLAENIIIELIDEKR